MADRTNPPQLMSRRRWLSAAALALPVAGLWPDVHVLAQQAQDFITGAPVPDIAPQRVSPLVLERRCMPSMSVDAAELLGVGSKACVQQTR